MFANWRIGPGGARLTARRWRSASAPTSCTLLFFAAAEFRRRRSLPFDFVTDQSLDRIDIFFIVARDECQRRTAAPGAAGAADAVHVILGVNRHIEIVDVRH